MEAVCLDAAVRLQGVSKTVPMAGGNVAILHGINLTVMKGESVAIMGPSGSGKSTLLGLVGGLDQPTAGRVEVLGRDLGQLSQEVLAEMRRSAVGFVFQAFHLIPALTALENVSLVLEMAGHPRAEREARDLLEAVGLSHRAHQFPHTLSGGEQQRVAVARALANRPALILADEPTGNLDSQTGAQVLSLLFKECHRHNAALMIVTHDPQVAAAADRVVHLRDGALVNQEVTGRAARR